MSALLRASATSSDRRRRPDVWLELLRFDLNCADDFMLSVVRPRFADGIGER